MTIKELEKSSMYLSNPDTDNTINSYKMDTLKFKYYAYLIIKDIQEDSSKVVSFLDTSILSKLSRLDILVLLRYMDSKVIKNPAIMELLNSKDYESIQLGMGLIKEALYKE